VKEMKILYAILLIVMSYLYGSIPFALVIGKLFFHKDVRKYGSGNLGGTNAGRVLGKPAGLAVIILDATKCIVAMSITKLCIIHLGVQADLYYISGLACIIGHCYPIFAGFKGGKGVSSAIAYALMTNIYAFLIAFITFMVVLKLSKYVSLSSMLGCVAVCIAAPFLGESLACIITNIIISCLVIYKHSANIQRIKAGNERKISWM
jgi:glycerol-3-phosphate acyltransferase PlsY